MTAYRNGEYLEFILTFDEAPATTVAAEPQQQQNSQSQNGWGNWAALETSAALAPTRPRHEFR